MYTDLSNCVHFQNVFLQYLSLYHKTQSEKYITRKELPQIGDPSNHYLVTKNALVLLCDILIVTVRGWFFSSAPLVQKAGNSSVKAGFIHLLVRNKQANV